MSTRDRSRAVRRVGEARRGRHGRVARGRCRGAGVVQGRQEAIQGCEEAREEVSPRDGGDGRRAQLRLEERDARVGSVAGLGAGVDMVCWQA